MSETLQLVLFTTGCAALATALLMPPGLIIAWLLSRFDWPGKSVMETLLLLPLVMPPVATGFVLLQFFSRHAFVGRLLHELGFPIVFTWRAVVIAAAVMAYPLFIRTVRVAMEGISKEQEESARILGASQWQTFWRVILPLSCRGIVAGAFLAFARALGEFGATILLAGNIPGQTTTLSLAIYSHILQGEEDQANLLLGALVGLAFAAAGIGEWLARYGRRE